MFRQLVSAWRDKAAAYRELHKSFRDIAEGTIRPFDVVGGYQRNHASASNPQNQVDKYKAWAYTCANRNAAGLAKANLRLYATRGVGQAKARVPARSLSEREMRLIKASPTAGRLPAVQKAEEIEEVLEHPFLDLMRNVNSFHNQFETIEATSIFLDLTGDAYWLIEPIEVGGAQIPGEIWVLQSQRIKIVPDPANYVKGYLYQREGGKPPLPLKPEEVIHFKRSNPQSMWYGMGRIQGAYWAIKGYESMEEYEIKQTDTNGIKDMIVNYKQGGITAKQRRDLISEWHHVLRTASRNHAPIIADADFDVKEASWSPKELAFLNGRKWRKDEIINAFGQHPAMYAENANTANIKGAIYLWEEFEIMSTLARIEQKLNEKLIPRYNEPRLFVKYDSVVDSDREQDRSDYDLLLKNGYPLNRILGKMGLEPVDGGDVGHIAMNSVPLGDAPSLDGGPRNNTPAKTGQSALTRKSNGSSGSGHIIIVKGDGDADVDRTGGANPPIRGSEVTIAAGMRKAWREQIKEAVKDASKNPNTAFEWVASEEWAQEIVDLTSGAITREFIIGGKAGAKEIAFGVTDFIDRPEVQNTIRNHTFDFARAVNEASAQILRDEMAAGLAKGESIAELTARIEATGQGWTDWRAKRVARTESARALISGKETQWRETGVVVEKVWDASGDACPFCLEMNGKTVSIGTSFFNVGDVQTVPWDNEAGEIKLAHNYLPVMGPPLHANCRCDIRPVIIME